MAVVAARLMVEVGADSRQAEAGLKSFDTKLKNAAKGMTSIGTKMTLGITTPLVGIGVSAVNLAADFEQSMNILQQVSGETESQLADLQAQALQLGADTVFSANEAAEGMLELAKAGMDTEQVMAAIPGVMSLAAAAGTDLGAAAGITAAALNAFGLEASESTRVADLLAAGANASAADITDLAAGLQQAGFAFAMANQPIESLVASLALLTNVGLTGSDAGTALKNAFMRMMNPTNEALELMKELNISFYDAQGNMMQLPAIIDMLNASLANLTPQQRDAALSTIFMSDGMKAMIPLLDAGSAGFNAMVGEVTQVGAATETANARMGGLSGGIETLKGAVESFMIGAALPFLDTLGGLARGAADAITRFGALPQPIINATLAIAGIAAAVGPVIVVLGTLAGAIGAIGAPVALAVTALAGLGVAWATNVGGIQQITAQVAGQVQQGFSQMLASAQQLAGGIQTAFSNTTFPSLQTLFAQFQAGDFQTVANTIRDTAFELMVNLNTELNISGHVQELRAQLESVLSGVGSAIALFGSQITGSFDVDLSAAGQRWSQSMSDLAETINSQDWSQFGSNLVKGIGAFLNTDVSWAENFANNFATSVRGAIASVNWGDVNTSFASLAVAVREAIYDVFGGIGLELAPLAAAANQSFATAMETLGNDIRTSIGSGFAGLNVEFAAAMTTLRTDMNSSISTTFTGMDSAFSTRMETLGASIRTSIGNFFSGLTSGVVSALAIDIDLPTIEWDTYIPKFTWGDWISVLQWTGYVATLGWAEFVAGLDWTAFVPGIAWSSFVTSLSWSSFVPSINWGSFIPDFSWGSFVPSLDWSRFIPWLNLGGGGDTTPSSGGGGGGGGFGTASGMVTAASASGITVNVEHMNSPMDVHSAAIALAREFRRRVR